MKSLQPRVNASLENSLAIDPSTDGWWPAEDIQADEMWDLASGGADPETELHEAGRRRLVWRAMKALGQLSREMIQLKEIQGLSLQEVAAVLGVPVGTVKSRSNRARLELAEQVLALSRESGPAELKPMA